MFRKIISNTGYQLFGRMISALIAFGATYLLARALGAAYYGEYVKITAFVSLFYLLADFGLNPIFLRENDGPKRTANFASFLGLRLFFSFMLMIAAMVIAVLIAQVNPGLGNLMVVGTVLGVASIVATGVSLSATALFQAWLRYDLQILSTNIGDLFFLLTLTLGLSALSHSADTSVLLAVFFETGGAIITALLSMWLVRKRISGPLISVDFATWMHLFWEGLPLGLVLVFNVIYFRIDLFLLSYFRPSSEVGAYGLAYKFFEFAIVLPTFIMNSWYPLLLDSRALGVVSQIGKKAYLLLVFLALVVGVGLWLGAPLIAFRNDFVPSVGLLRALSLSLPLFFVTSPLMWQFILEKKQHLLVWVYAAATSINIVLNIVYIPIFGALAAAIITGITEFAVLAGGWMALRWGRRNI